LLQRVSHSNRGYFGIANAGAGGVFLGSGLLHMLPDSQDGFTELGMTSYPYSVLFMGIGFFMTMILELFLSPGHEAIIEIGGGSDSRNPLNSSSKPKPMELAGNRGNSNNLNSSILKKRRDSLTSTSCMSSPTPSKLSDPLIADEANRVKERKWWRALPGRRGRKRNLKGNNGSMRKQHVNEVWRSGSPGPFNRMAQWNETNEEDDLEALLLEKSSVKTSGSPKLTRVTKDESRAKGKKLSNDKVNSQRITGYDLCLQYHSRTFETGYHFARTLMQQNGGPELPPLKPQEDDDNLSSSKLTAVILVFILTLHSFITGLATGSSDVSQDGYMIIILALCVHKTVAAMSVGITVKKACWTLKKGSLFILVFSFSTPLGIASGLILKESLKNASAKESFTSISMAIGSGSFVYLAIMENIVEEFVESRSNRKSKLACCLFGFTLMAVLALFS